MLDTQAPPEKAVLVGVQLGDMQGWELAYSLDELASLADTAGVTTLGRCTQARQQVSASTYIGRGKVEEVRNLALSVGADVVIFDNELSPAQISNLEKQIGVRVMDRSDVILHIFAERAQTKEAKIQVDLARMKYFLPRLKRQWTHLERQVGGVGVRGGMGEKQIEIDRRLIRKKIDRYEEDLRLIEKQRNLRERNRINQFTIALVGYTNVGKSTLFNRLTSADVLVENRLFATLDSTVREIELGGHAFTLSDTVGFIRKLPHHLVASFRSTLEGALQADLLLHVVDMTSPVLEEQIRAVDEVLSQLNVKDKPTIYAINKMDLATPEQQQEIWRHIPANAPYVTISAHTGEHVDMLQELIVDTFADQFKQETFVIPLRHSKWVARLHEIATIQSEEYLPNNQIKIRCYGPTKLIEQFRKGWREVLATEGAKA